MLETVRPIEANLQILRLPDGLYPYLINTAKNIDKHLTHVFKSFLSIQCEFY